jgi:hypothetical protein
MTRKWKASKGKFWDQRHQAVTVYISSVFTATRHNTKYSNLSTLQTCHNELLFHLRLLILTCIVLNSITEIVTEHIH